MDPITLAINGGALIVLAGRKVVNHIRVGRVKDQQIATVRSQIDQLAEVTYTGWNDQAVAMEQIHKTEIDVLKLRGAGSAQSHLPLAGWRPVLDEAADRDGSDVPSFRNGLCEGEGRCRPETIGAGEQRWGLRSRPTGRSDRWAQAGVDRQ